MAMAPLVCSCGEPVRLLAERPDDGPDGTEGVVVGHLICLNGHEWVDFRDVENPRPHHPLG